MKEYLLHRSYRDYFLFTFGINSGLRISDILPLRVMDVKYTEHLRVKENEKCTKNQDDRSFKTRNREIHAWES